MTGAYVAILAAGDPSKKAPFGQWSPAIAETVNALRLRGIQAVAMAVDDLSPDPFVRVWRPGLRQRWLAERKRPPKIFYNRILNRSRERRSEVQSSLRALQQKGNILFNPGYLSKADLHRRLSGSAVASYLPETTLQPLPRDVFAMLERRSCLYLKPVDSCGGKGIFQICQNASGWQVTEVRKKRALPVAFHEEEKLLCWLDDLLARREYLSQQALFFDRIDDRPYDFRVLVQKDGRGCWTYVDAGIRLAAPGHVVTHRPNGGQILRRDQLVRARFDRFRWKRIESEMASAAVAAARAMEANSHEHFGILTLDMGLEQPGEHLWLLEINAKPGRFDEPWIQRKSDFLLASYVKHLAARRGEIHENIYSP
ncbi:hypothetical protein GTO89_12130 [Heliobacterium gestii]|uniref:ATP-grasp domain-containing protein n=1 Tax=Heliomicrobium gestii TaxID=2699 RepID=A0A845LAW1_HELGE|nr:YheC/YheD family protein [Heliomicrobium gestii]MBM7867237.1 hypothetical protein [Heliomicrobium gestii]MZP43792.1 hypothetical protein [Heliomicrobium gestii]